MERKKTRLKPLEKIPFKTDKKDIIVFLDDVEDRIWEDAVTADFAKGYSEKDAAYDNL